METLRDFRWSGLTGCDSSWRPTGEYPCRSSHISRSSAVTSSSPGVTWPLVLHWGLDSRDLERVRSMVQAFILGWDASALTAIPPAVSSPIFYPNPSAHLHGHMIGERWRQRRRSYGTLGAAAITSCSFFPSFFRMGVYRLARLFPCLAAAFLAGFCRVQPSFSNSICSTAPDQFLPLGSSLDSVRGRQGLEIWRE